MTADRTIAEALLDIGAVLLRPDEPFTWSSGLRAPIYCDNRLTMAYPDVRGQIADRFASIVRQEDWAADVIVGTATAGIPHAAWLAERLGAPMAYVRDSMKGHGRRNKVEGRVSEGDRAVIVEDLISTGGSVLNVVETLRAMGVQVEAVLAIFSYGLDASSRRLGEAAVSPTTLTSLEALLETARRRNMIAPAAVETLREWKKDPETWSENYHRRTVDR